MAQTNTKVPPADPRLSPLLPNFPTTVDIKTAYLLMRDYTKRHFPLIAYQQLLTTVEELDEVHGEIPERAKRWSAPFWLRAFVVPEPVTQSLTKFGLEEQRNVEMFFTVPDLVESGLADQNTTTFELKVKTQGLGDHFFYHGVEYEVRHFVPHARWGNTDIILYYSIKAEIYRQPSSAVNGMI